MLFLLRSTVWLGIVFWAMPWSGEGSPGPAAMNAARSVAHSGMRAATEICTASPAECLEAARQLHALFEQVALEEKAATAALSAGSPLLPQDLQTQWRPARR